MKSIIKSILFVIPFIFVMIFATTKAHAQVPPATDLIIFCELGDFTVCLPPTPTPTPTPIPLYTISGNVFVDNNKNGIIDSGETDYASAFTITISPNAGTIATNANGTYTISNLPAGTYTVSYPNLPASYQMTSPLNGPPASYVVTVGPACTTNGAPGATCQ